MDRWAYREYKEIVEENVNEAIEDLGYTVNQSIGYAEYQLELRLRECPTEKVMVLTALAIAAYQRGGLSSSSTSDDWVRVELTAAYCNKEHIAISGNLDDADRQEFIADTEIVSKVLGK